MVDYGIVEGLTNFELEKCLDLLWENPGGFY